MVDLGPDGRAHLAFVDGSHGGSPGNSFILYARQVAGLGLGAEPAALAS